MDVIGNNIANVNTTGYKASRVIFQDVFSQTVQAGSPNRVEDLGIGGTNAMQIGLGIRLSSIDVLHTPSAFGRTDNPTDMTINGEGFFIVRREGAAAGGDDETFFTRAGNFRIDSDGYLVTSHGFLVLGFGVDDDGNSDGVLGPIQMDMLTQNQLRVDQNGEITVNEADERVTIGILGIAIFPNPAGLEKVGNSLYVLTPAAGPAGDDWEDQLVTVANDPLMGSGSIMTGGLEMSNVDIATEFTDMIVTQRGFQANSRIITVSDTMLEELVNLKR